MSLKSTNGKRKVRVTPSTPSKKTRKNSQKYAPGADEAEATGIVLRKFYPPEMHNARCFQYNNNELTRPN